MPLSFHQVWSSHANKRIPGPSTRWNSLSTSESLFVSHFIRVSLCCGLKVFSPSHTTSPMLDCQYAMRARMRMYDNGFVYAQMCALVRYSYQPWWRVYSVFEYDRAWYSRFFESMMQWLIWYHFTIRYKKWVVTEERMSNEWWTWQLLSNYWGVTGKQNSGYCIRYCVTNNEQPGP